MSFDWNNAAENALAGALGLVPEAGSMLSALVYIFWPAGEDVWDEIKAQVEELIDEKIGELVYQQVKDDLSGLKNVLNDYLAAVQTGDTEVISEQWIATNTVFDDALPHFQSSGYEVLLVPLFAQFANLNLSLLRDGALFGSSWGWNQSFQQMVSGKLTNNIAAFTLYANWQAQWGVQDAINNTGSDNHACEPFRSVNVVGRQMTLSVWDFVNTWPYFDPANYPKPVSIYLDREIHSDPVGTCDDSGAINLPYPWPTQPISQITVWAWDRIDAVQLSYPSGGGPGGVTETARMGDNSGGSNQPPHGGVFDVSNNPVTVAGGSSGDILNAFTFTFKDGTSTGQLGGNYVGGSPFSFSYDGEILSSIHINGVSEFYGSADCAVFGFKYEQSQTVNPDTMKLLYVTSPSGATLDELAARSVAKQVPLPKLAARAAAEGWDAQRQEYWKQLKSRGKN